MTSGNKRQWVAPIVLLTTIAGVAFAVLYLVDHYVTGGKWSEQHGVVKSYVFFDQGSITDAVSGLGAMIAAVLGIVLTVVSIVVQLSAERYTGVTTMFFKDRTNIAVLGYYVIACVCGIWLWLSVSLRDFVPRATLLAMMASTTVGLVLMAPYFAYVFRFLEPQHHPAHPPRGRRHRPQRHGRERRVHRAELQDAHPLRDGGAHRLSAATPSPARTRSSPATPSTPSRTSPSRTCAT